MHSEQPYDDYEREPLLPYKLSQLGPGLAWGDADGDGDDDLYAGGAAGQAGALFHNARGEFKKMQNGPWEEDKACEDMAPLWFDADADGDLDLYVVSGGNEAGPGDAVFQDRLYINSDGSGSFQRAPRGALPVLTESGSAAAASDFDRDGDLDLFVGSRMTPGKYPLTPRSFLLRNEGDEFRDATDSVAPDLRRVGLVTGAVWSDATGDGWTDLLVTLAWSPIRVFGNRGRRAGRRHRSERAPALLRLVERHRRRRHRQRRRPRLRGDQRGPQHQVSPHRGYPGCHVRPGFRQQRNLDLVETEFEGETERWLEEMERFPISTQKFERPMVPLLRRAWQDGSFRLYKNVDENVHLTTPNIWKGPFEGGLAGSRINLGGAIRRDDMWQHARLETEIRQHVFETVQFYRAHVPGFEQAYLLVTAPYFGSRGGPHIDAERTITPYDVYDGRRFDDVVFVNTHSAQPKWGAAPAGFDTPYRTLIPRGLDGLMATGRASGYLRRGHDPGSVRARPALLQLGEVCGLAAAMAAGAGVPPRCAGREGAAARAHRARLPPGRSGAAARARTGVTPP